MFGVPMNAICDLDGTAEVENLADSQFLKLNSAICSHRRRVATTEHEILAYRETIRGLVAFNVAEHGYAVYVDEW